MAAINWSSISSVNSSRRNRRARLSLPSKAATFLKPLLARVTAGVDAVAAAARSGVLRVDDEL
ncbi:MAG: hypothetical protein KA249_11870, partial [Dermatophilaceae bacterium]|nr:hypothetical protein [Dermatophilaceae bacterium]